MQRLFTPLITFFSGIRSIALIVFGVAFLVCAGMALYDAATLWQARGWPSVEARVDQCTMNMHYSKQDSWWDVSATFSYGDGFARHYQETWTPPDTPRYSRHPDPVISESEQSALAKRFCDKAAAEGLRVSPDHPWMAWRSEAVATGEWKTNVVMISVCGLGAVILIALGVSLWPGREAAVKAAGRRKRLQAARKKV